MPKKWSIILNFYFQCLTFAVKPSESSVLPQLGGLDAEHVRSSEVLVRGPILLHLKTKSWLITRKRNSLLQWANSPFWITSPPQITSGFHHGMKLSRFTKRGATLYSDTECHWMMTAAGKHKILSLRWNSESIKQRQTYVTVCRKHCWQPTTQLLLYKRRSDVSGSPLGCGNSRCLKMG